jgi:predicted small integral membrane protein
MRRTSSAALAVAAVLTGLAVVVLASRGAPGDRTAAAFETASTGRTLFLSVLGVAFVVCAALAVWSLWPDGSAVVRPPSRFRWLPYIAITVLIFVLAMFAPERRATEGFTDDSRVIDGTPRDRGDEAAPEFDGRASATASMALVAIAITALVAYTVVGRARRAADVDGDEPAPGGSAAPPGEPALEADVVAELRAGGLDGAIAAVRAEPDPRRAVLLAYAALEARLAPTGAARAPAATPHEWLRAIRRELAADHGGVVEAARQLTGLYERGRFSVSPLGESDRAIALDALGALRALPVTDASSGRRR